jgi:putative spermidine/putrescine transport system substrate-binding protein
MLLRTLLATAALLVAPWLAILPAAASPSDLTIVTRDDATQRAVQSAYVQPFTAVTGTPVQQEIWEGGIDALRAHAKPPEQKAPDSKPADAKVADPKAPDPKASDPKPPEVKAPDTPWDLVLLDPEELSLGCGEGLLEKLDWSAIGGKDHYAPMAVSDCGLGAVVANTVLAWDKDKLPVAPTWSDFWDVAKYPGKRGLRKGVRGNLEIALLADGVAPGDIYKTLATNDGVDRAFRKLDQIKPYIEWWSTGAEAAHILASGDVLMTSAPSGPIMTAAEKQHRGFGVQFANSLYEVQSWGIIKGSTALRLAQQFLYFTGMPAIEVRLLKDIGDSGFAKGLNDGLPPEVMATSPGNPANLSAGLKIDAGFWHDNLAKLKPRYDAWLGH